MDQVCCGNSGAKILLIEAAGFFRSSNRCWTRIVFIKRCGGVEYGGMFSYWPRWDLHGVEHLEVFDDVQPLVAGEVETDDSRRIRRGVTELMASVGIATQRSVIEEGSFDFLVNEADLDRIELLRTSPEGLFSLAHWR